jgi:hypothetical protein
MQRDEAYRGCDREELRESECPMKKGKTTPGENIIASLNEALLYSKGERVPGIRVTTVLVPTIDVRRLRQKLKMSQNDFAAKFGFLPPLCAIGNRDATGPMALPAPFSRS